jgi:hypothetical protein
MPDPLQGKPHIGNFQADVVVVDLLVEVALDVVDLADVADLPAGVAEGGQGRVVVEDRLTA